jgi:hypothetical protein
MFQISISTFEKALHYAITLTIAPNPLLVDCKYQMQDGFIYLFLSTRR